MGQRLESSLTGSCESELVLTICPSHPTLGVGPSEIVSYPHSKSCAQMCIAPLCVTTTLGKTQLENGSRVVHPYKGTLFSNGEGQTGQMSNC